jgi:hypothetical protein
MTNELYGRINFNMVVVIVRETFAKMLKAKRKSVSDRIYESETGNFEASKQKFINYLHQILRFTALGFYFLRSYKPDHLTYIFRYSANRGEHCKATRIFNSCSKNEKKKG